MELSRKISPEDAYQLIKDELKKLKSVVRNLSKMNVELISVTPDAENIACCARVSNPSNQNNEKFSGLLKYCVKHQH